MTLTSSKTGHFLKSKCSYRNLYGRNSVLWLPLLLECKKSSSSSRLNPSASIRCSAHIQILNLLIGKNGCQGLALKSVREKKKYLSWNGRICFVGEEVTWPLDRLQRHRNSLSRNRGSGCEKWARVELAVMNSLETATAARNSDPRLVCAQSLLILYLNTAVHLKFLS